MIRRRAAFTCAAIAATALTCGIAPIVRAAPLEEITAESKNAWLILYNADTSGLDENSNGVNDSIEWKDWFISTHGISQPRTLGLIDPDGLWNKEWAGMQEDLISSSGLWTQVTDYLDTGTNAEQVIGILVGYNVPGIWDVYSRSPCQNGGNPPCGPSGEISIAFRRGAKSVASALARITLQPPAPGRDHVSNPIYLPMDLNFWRCGTVQAWPQLPSTGNLTKQLLLSRGHERLFITARIDGPTLENAKDLTRRALAINNGTVTIGPDERFWQDWIDDRENLPFWPDLNTAVNVAHRDLRWEKFMFDGTTDYDPNGTKECSSLPCPPPIRPTNDLAWFGFEFNNGWATDINGDGIHDQTFPVLCQQPYGSRLFAGAWISWGGVTLRHRATDPRPVTAYSDNPPRNPNYLTTNNTASVDSQFSFNALWPDCDGDGVIDATGGFAAIVASPTCEPGTAGFLNTSVFIERIRNGATFAEASLIASPRLQHNFEFVGDPFLKLPRPLPADCNANGIDDYLEYTLGSETDDNGNNLLDACETDCDADGVNDACALARGQVADCNANAQPDFCDICAVIASDCDFNGVPDECDLAAGTATDLNANDLADSCEDCNTNGIPDFLPEDCAVYDDYDRDGDVDLADYAAFQRCLGELPDVPCGCAFDYGETFNDAVDLADFTKFVDQVSAGTGPVSQACWQQIQAARYAEICPSPP